MEQPKQPQPFKTRQTNQLLTAALMRNAKIGTNNFHHKQPLVQLDGSVYKFYWIYNVTICPARSTAHPIREQSHLD